MLANLFINYLTSHALKVVSMLATTDISNPLLNFRRSPFLNFALPVQTNLFGSLFCDQLARQRHLTSCSWLLADVPAGWLVLVLCSASPIAFGVPKQAEKKLLPIGKAFSYLLSSVLHV